jgi:hypothetical protein
MNTNIYAGNITDVLITITLEICVTTIFTSTLKIKAITFLQNFDNHLQDFTESKPRKLQSTSSPP